ncbi:glycine zipper domain-containing protein [Novosphingobium sp. ZN18A2]|uniref:hypothetical protein n=1 Tax=Novosphingobium sp. ZN18A2 TaxID=3079861 RepID=UPI0030D54FCC
MKMLVLVPIAAGALALGGCARNYAGEGALAGAAAGAGVAAVTDGNVAKGAAIGAAAGAAGGALIKKDGKCYRRDGYGREYRVRCR